jgi:hypothetical protein
MKYVLTLEKYYAYKDFDKSKWGEPHQIEEDLRGVIVRLFTYGNISDKFDNVDYMDVSSDKGIKWEITIKHTEGKDILHAYKNSSWRGDYEFYLNKKKITEYELQQMFLQKFVTPLDQYIASMKSFDKYHAYADDHSAWKKGKAHVDRLRDMYNMLQSSDKKKAYKEFKNTHKTDLPFKDFSGS